MSSGPPSYLAPKACKASATLYPRHRQYKSETGGERSTDLNWIFGVFLSFGHDGLYIDIDLI